VISSKPNTKIPNPGPQTRSSSPHSVPSLLQSYSSLNSVISSYPNSKEEFLKRWHSFLVGQTLLFIVSMIQELMTKSEMVYSLVHNTIPISLPPSTPPFVATSLPSFRISFRINCKYPVHANSSSVGGRLRSISGVHRCQRQFLSRRCRSSKSFDSGL